jgi:hypothetical protein
MQNIFSLAFARALHDERYEQGIYSSGLMARRIDLKSTDTYRQIETGRRPIPERVVPKILEVIPKVSESHFNRVRTATHTLDRLLRSGGVERARMYVRDILSHDHELGVLLYSLFPLLGKIQNQRPYAGIRLVEESGAVFAIRTYWRVH